MNGRERDGERITVHVPSELPALNESTSRLLLGILVELTKTEVLDDPPERDTE